jgi:hypothetical protein
MAYVAPATAKSTVLAFVSREADVTNILVAMTMTTNLAVKLIMASQRMTGAKRRKVVSGAKPKRAARAVHDRGKTWT